jgi:hypothetical protein
MERLDYYDIRPAGMDAYLSSYGRHISKPMYLWAVSMMRDRDGRRLKPMEKSEVRDLLKSYGVTVENDKGYDAPYVLMMAKADYFGSSISDDAHLTLYVKDYLDDKDGSPTRAFDELYTKTIAMGIPVDWPDLI